MKFIYTLLLTLIISSIFSCNESIEEPVSEVGFWESHEPFKLEYSLSMGMARSDKFTASGQALGKSNLIEASGIVISLANPGYLWTHEDKNNTNEIFLLDAMTGETVASYTLTGISNRDWEDIEIGPGPIDGVNYIYLGEVGDNDRVYRDYKIYRFEEPVFEEGHRGKKNPIVNDEIHTIKFNYPENKRHDVETLLLDPWTKDLYLVTKRDFNSIIYVLPFPQNTDQETDAILVGEFPFTRAVGGNVSLDGREMLIKTYDFIMHWERGEDEDMVDMFVKTPKLAPYNPAEPQGEAICFDNNKGYFTLSEFSNAIVPVLYHYERIRP